MSYLGLTLDCPSPSLTLLRGKGRAAATASHACRWHSELCVWAKYTEVEREGRLPGPRTLCSVKQEALGLGQEGQ